LPKQIGPYGRLARWILGHRGIASLAIAAVTGVSIACATQLDVDSNLLSLLPEDDPSAMALRRLHAEEGGVNLVTLAFEAEAPEEIGPYLDDLVARLEERPDVRFAIHEIDPDLAFRIGLLQLEAVEVTELTGRVRGALALGPALNPIVSQRLMDLGPLTQRIAGAGEVALLDDEADGRGRVLVRPTGASSDPVFSKALIDGIDAVIADSHPEARGVRLQWMGGAYRHAVEDREGIWRDLQATGLASAILVLAVIALAFRSLRATLMLYGPLLIANAVSLGVVWLLYGTINTYTSFGSAILLGLGTDFAMHLLGRYREERTHGLGLGAAIERAWDKAGPPCTTAALTGAAGFLALATGEFQGFSQLGIILAIGIVVCLLLVLVGVPLLIPLLDAAPPPSVAITARSGRPSTATYRLAPVGLMVVVLASGVAATRLRELDWEYDISALRSDGLSYAELTPEEQALARESYSPVVITVPDKVTLVREQRRLEERLEAGAMPHVSKILSIENVLPSDQGDRIAALHDLAALMDHPNLRYLPPPITQNLIGLREWDGSPLLETDVPPALMALLGAGRADQHRILLLPRGNMWDLREAAALADEVDAALPGREAAGEYIALGALFRIVRRDMPTVSVLSLLLVTALAAIDLRRLKWVVGAIGTLLAGVAWAGVAIEVTGIKLSILNIVGVPILFGICVDVCVHLVHRLEEEGPGGVWRALSTTGMASALSTFTSILAFGTLLLATNRGVRSLGSLVAIGLLVVFIVTAVMLPLAWAAGWRVSGKAPVDHRRHKHHPTQDE
jgi:predicted exporter